MARGTQHRKRRPRPHARPAATVTAPPAPAKQRRKQKPPQWQEQLFFSRLRVHAKWMFVVLAAVFALGFVIFGVGSGSTGISDALQNAFNFGGGSSGPSISSLKHKTAAHPKDPTAWRDLATAYEQKQQTGNAISALKRYTALRPKDTSALQELASQYSSLANTYSTQAQDAQAAVQTADPGSIFAPPSTTALGRAFTDPSKLQDPIAAALSQQATTRATTVYQKLTSVEAQAESTYRKLAKLDPTDASTQVQLGQAAQAANDTKTAIAAYRRFLELAPTDPLAPQVRAVLKQLAPVKK